MKSVFKNALFLVICFSLFAFTSISKAEFQDVPPSHTNQAAINFLAENEVVEGYEDGTFKPSQPINRAEFLKIAIESSEVNFIISDSTLETPCFSDVPADSWFAPYVCAANAADIIGGYEDGTFKPSKTITLVEAAKIITLVNQEDLPEIDSPENWYDPFMQTLDKNNYIPPSFDYLNQKVTRAQMAELTWRIVEEKQDQLHTDFEELAGQTCRIATTTLPTNIDIDRVRHTWLSWLNEARSSEGLDPYTLNDHLNYSATTWSNFSRDRGYIDHKRPGTTAYYDYNAITEWYRNLGLTFENIYGVTHSENISWDVYSCSEEDCTDEVIEKARNGFDFFMSEKGKAYAPHYNSITNDYFKEIGFGVATGGGKVFFTTHYGTALTSSPPDVCPY